MNYEIVFNLNNFSLQGFHAIELSDFVFTDNFYIREGFFDVKLMEAVGTVNSTYPKDRAFVYYQKPSSIAADVTEYELRSALDDFTHRKIDELKLFLIFLWLIKDNSAGFGYVVGRAQNTQWVVLTSENQLPTLASGDHQNSFFTLSELESANDLFIIYNTKIKSQQIIGRENNTYYISEETAIIRSIIKNHDRLFDHNKTNCIERSLHFLEIARKEDYLMYKIAFYMPVLECLFLTDSKDLLQKLRYRIAFYIGKDRTERKSIDTLITECYDIRSKFIHGQVYSASSSHNHLKLLEYAVRLDELIRRILKFIIIHDLDRFLEPKKELRESYFNKLIYDLEGYPYRF